MDDKNFGEILKLLLDISGEKCAVLAQYLKYDTSYISKWLSGSRLPACKCREALALKLCRFFITHAAHERLPDYAAALELEVQPWELADLRSLLYEHLYSHLKRSLEIKPSAVAAMPFSLPNSVLLLDRDAANTLVEESIRQYCKTAPENDIYFISTHSPSRYLIKESIDELYEKTVSIYANKTLNFSQLLECSDTCSAAEYCKIILLHIHHSIRVHYRLYIGKAADTVRVMVIKNCVCSIEFFDNMLDRLYRCITKSPEIVNDVFYKYQQFLNAKTLVFQHCTIESLCVKHYFSNFIMQPDFDCLMHTMRSFLSPTDLEKHSNSVLLPEDIKVFLGVLNNPALRGKIRILLYKSALMDFILYGKSGLFGNSYTVSKKDRIQQLESLVFAVKSDDTFELRLLEDTHPLISRNNLDCSLYMNTSSMFAMKDEIAASESGCYLFIDDGALHAFKQFFNELWNDDNPQNLLNLSVVDFLEKGIAVIKNM
ncbi:MAG: hypothetical protein RR573_01350 [Oscillospiraceae bacterium]